MARWVISPFSTVDEQSLLSSWRRQATSSFFKDLPADERFEQYDDDKDNCQDHGYDWDDNEKCCYDHNHQKWDKDNWSKKKDECSKMKYDWDDGEKCCYDNEHQKWEYNERDVDHREKCDRKDYDWDDSQKCCYDKNHKEWDYDDDDDDKHKQKCGEIGYDWDDGQKCRSWGQLPINVLSQAFANLPAIQAATTMITRDGITMTR